MRSCGCGYSCRCSSSSYFSAGGGEGWGWGVFLLPVYSSAFLIGAQQDDFLQVNFICFQKEMFSALIYIYAEYFGCHFPFKVLLIQYLSHYFEFYPYPYFPLSLLKNLITCPQVLHTVTTTEYIVREHQSCALRNACNPCCHTPVARIYLAVMERKVVNNWATE